MFRPRFVGLLLALITLLVYLPVARHSFITLDDDLYVETNRMVRNGLTWAGTQWAFTTYHASNWHPLTWLSHMLDCQLYGLDAGKHRYTNVFLHTANAVLLLWLLLRLTGSLWPSAFVAALFAWHPLFVESAAWIAERKNVLSTFFGLLALLAYANYAAKPSPAQDQTRQPRLLPWVWAYWLALFFFALSLLAKPALVTLPFVLLLLDYWPLQRFGPDGLRVRQSLRLALEKWPFFLLVVPACVMTCLAQSHGGMVIMLQPLPLGVRLCNALHSYVLYLWKAIWPTNLCILYPYPPTSQLFALAAPAAVFLLIITWLVWRFHRRHGYLLTGWLWFLGTLVPMIGLVQVGLQARNDHHAYVPLIGIFMALAFGCRDLLARFRFGPALPATAAGLALGACLMVSEHQLSYWRDDETVFSRALAITKDNGPAHNNLGVALALKGRQAEAQPHFEAACRLEPRWADPHNNLGKVLSNAGKHAEALTEFATAVQFNPRSAVMRDNLGMTLAELGRLEEALLQLTEAARLDPTYPWPPFHIGWVLLQQGHDAEGIEQCRAALRLAPNQVQMLTFIAKVLSSHENPELRDGKAALDLAQRACALSGGEPHALDALGMAYAETGNFTNAQTAAADAFKIATAAKLKDLEALQQRQVLFQRHQPWRQSFRSAN